MSWIFPQIFCLQVILLKMKQQQHDINLRRTRKKIRVPDGIWTHDPPWSSQVIFPRYSLALFSSFSIPPHWSWLVGNLLQPIRSTSQIWVVTRHQFGIPRLVSQTLFRGATSGGVEKSRLYSPATRSSLRSRRLGLVGTRRHGPARRRHARGEGAPARKAPENRFPPLI